MEARVRFSVNWCWSRSHLKAQLFLYLINSFFFLDTFTSSFQTILNRFWFLLTLFDCLCNHLITSEKNKTKTQKVWLSHWFILFGAYRPQSAFPAYKKSEKKSKIKLASSRYIVFSNQAEINQVKTERTKISTQPDTSLCMQ